MMHGAITDDMARHLAGLAALLHPGWDVPGIRAAIHRARHRAPAHEVAHALLRLAMRSELDTPALLAEDGPHWSGTRAADDPRAARCPEPGHSSYLAWNCGACRSEQIAPDPSTVPAPTYALTPEQVARNERWLRTIRAQTTTHAGAAGRTEED